jgi:nucleotide-binding universal stress UspA family protein
MSVSNLAFEDRPEHRSRLRTILVPHDLTEHSSRSLHLAMDLAQGSGCALHLAHAIDSATFAWPAAEPAWLAWIADTTADARDRSRELLRAAMEREGVSARLHIVLGPPARAICALAREIRADLIVMTSRRRSRLEHVLRGGVLLHTLRHTPCPVVTIPRAEGAARD